MTNDRLLSIATPDSEVPAGTLADEEALLRVKALLASRGVNAPTSEQLVAAAREVFTAKPSLGRRYQLQPDQITRGAS